MAGKDEKNPDIVSPPKKEDLGVELGIEFNELRFGELGHGVSPEG